MAKKEKKEDNTEESEKKSVSATELLSGYMKQHKKDHLSFEPTIEYTTSTSSLLFDSAIDGGMGPGCVRALGIASGGKSSCVLAVIKNFLEDTSSRRKAIYFRSEGRLSKRIQKRSGVKFIEGLEFEEHPENFKDGMCLIVDSNVYEFVFTMIRNLIEDNSEGILWNFVIDSADTMCKRADLAKPFEDSDQVAGGALLTSTFFKKTGTALAKRGHRAFFIGQRRDFIKTDNRQKTPQRQGNASGSNSVQHQADWVFEFLQRTEFDKDFIREDPADDKSKIIGHWCKLKIIKSDNESNETIVRYPIKYGRENGQSVWVEYEICDLLLSWELLVKKGSWFNFDLTFLAELTENGFTEVPEKIQGIHNVRTMLENQPKLTKYLYDKFKSLLSNK